MRALIRFGALLSLIMAATACDERIVYRDRELFEPVQTAAASFVGYTEQAEKLAVCGNCHIDQQSEWAETAHAGAWATLAAVPAAQRQASCENCHSVTEIGNPAEGVAGYEGTKDPRYHDVQCESCHGPGLPHVENPGRTQPHAQVAVNAATTAADTANRLTSGCGECHSGAHHPFVEEWSRSGHGRVIASPSTQAACQGCHTGQAALLAMGETSNYVEKTSSTPLPITCAVCHDPHRKDFEGQLRYSISVPNEEQNLCMRCHHKRGAPDPTNLTRGPHSPQGPLLLGEAGWWPPNMPFDSTNRIIGTHGTQRNPRLCAGCHVYQYQARDKLTGSLTVSTVGHLFKARPCVDANGQPSAVQNCTDTQRTYRSCATSGCHGSEQAARSAFNTALLRLTTLNTTLKDLLARVPASEFSGTDNRYSTAEGSRFNSQLIDFQGTTAHNPFLAEALLIGSINQMRKDYNLPATLIDLRPQLKAPPGLH